MYGQRTSFCLPIATIKDKLYLSAFHPAFPVRTGYVIIDQMIGKFAALRGFTLIELSIVLVTVSIGFASAITIAGSKSGVQQIKDTSRELSDLDKAMISYAKNYHSLPCPANAESNLSSETAGVATYSATPTDPKNPCITDNYFTADGAVAIGMVPFRTLGIPSSYAVDNYGNRITYAVTQSLASPDACNADGSISVLDETRAPIVDNAAYVLVSHGKNGVGAWPFFWHGQRNLPPGGTANGTETENNHIKDNKFDNVFIRAMHPLIGFDDQVTYQLKDQLDL